MQILHVKCVNQVALLEIMKLFEHSLQPASVMVSVLKSVDNSTENDPNVVSSRFFYHPFQNARISAISCNFISASVGITND